MKKYRFALVMPFVLLWVSGLFLGPAGQAHAQTSLDWMDPINLSNSGASSDPSIVIDFRGIIRVIWVDKFDGYKYVETVDGITWTSPATVLFPFSPDDNPRPVFIPDPSGEIHILWRDRSNALFYARSLPSNFDKPSTWTGNFKLANSVVDFEAEIGSRGTFHIGYLTSLGTDVEPPGIYYRRLSGSGWSAAKNLYSSQYFRSLEAEDANIRLSVSVEDNVDRIYMVWDDRPQKRVFLTRSTDGGDLWDGVAQIQGPEDSSSLELPYNINVNNFNGRTLLVWQVGIPGSYCTQHSQWSFDGGNQFGAPVRITDEFAACPRQTDFIFQNEEFLVALMSTQDDFSMIAWNGSGWSELQTQSQLSNFINPATFDSVIFGCQDVAVSNGKIFVVGCDVGGGGDIWFSSRSLGSLEEWFPPPSAWTSPTSLTSVDQEISALASVADANNNIHVFWAQAPLSAAEEGDPSIYYARWNGQWSEPRSVISVVNDAPTHLSITADNQGRLLLSWVEGRNGDLYFSWANADRAGTVSEWSRPAQVPTASQLSSSPEILVDDAEKIVIVYSVPVNEGRGIYIVQSDDLGRTWSQPINVMDAVEAGWDSTDRPAISLSGDGTLHVLFTRYSLREDGRSEGLYYSQSSNGGMTWSQPQVVSERSVQWSRMVYLNDGALHILWQERLGTGLVTFHQLSHDGGVSWETPITVTNLLEDSAEVAFATDVGGNMHFVQVYQRDDTLVLQVLMWNGSQWGPPEERVVGLRENNIVYSTAAEVSSGGTIQVVLSLGYPDLTNEVKSEMLSIGRSVGQFSPASSASLLLISTPSALSDLPVTVDIEPTSTESSPLTGIYDSPAPSRRNLFVMLLVGVLVVVIVVFVIPARKKRSN